MNAFLITVLNKIGSTNKLFKCNCCCVQKKTEIYTLQCSTGLTTIGILTTLLRITQDSLNF